MRVLLVEDDAAIRLLVHDILTDDGVSTVEQLLVGVELVLEESATQFLLHQTFGLAGVLPLGETHSFHDLVNVSHDAFDDDVSVAAPGFPER